jgi:hypothetical protein
MLLSRTVAGGMRCTAAVPRIRVGAVPVLLVELPWRKPLMLALRAASSAATGADSSNWRNPQARAFARPRGAPVCGVPRQMRWRVR